MEQLSAVVQLKNITSSKPQGAGAATAWSGQTVKTPRRPRTASSAPPLTQTAGLPEGGGGSPTYIPQNDPHDALIILHVHNGGGKFFSKIFAHQLRLPSAKVRPGGRVRVKILFLCFSSIFEFSKILSILSIDT